MDHHHGHHHHDRQDHGSDDAWLADVLDLDAEVLGGYLDELTAWAAGHTEASPRTILDIGAGTGGGTLALARRFEDAELIAIDHSPAMLDRVRSAAASRGLAERLRTLEADLDAGWPDLDAGRRGGAVAESAGAGSGSATGPDAAGPSAGRRVREIADLAWASASLHHLADPDRVMADVHAALKPGGLFVVVEMDAMPRFLPGDVHPGLEERALRIGARNGWNAWPNWTGHLERAGFAVLEERVFAIDVRPEPALAARYAHPVLSGLRGRMADELSAADLAAFDRLLDPADEEFVLRRTDLVVRGTRTAWAARRR